MRTRTGKTKSVIEQAVTAERRLANYDNLRLKYLATVPAPVRRILLADGRVSEQDEAQLVELSRSVDGAADANAGVEDNVLAAEQAALPGYTPKSGAEA